MRGLVKAVAWGLAVLVLMASGGSLPAVLLSVVLAGWALKA